jgi:hypothetical protein
MSGYGLCPICGKPLGDDSFDFHTWTEDGVSDVHAECCHLSGTCPADHDDDDDDAVKS